MRQPVILLLFLDSGNIWPVGRMVDSVVTIAVLCASSRKCWKADISSLVSG